LEKLNYKKIIDLQPFEFYTPEFAFQEIKKYKSEIILKSKISKKEYLNTILELKKKIIVINEKKYFTEIKTITKIPDDNDIDFIALSKHLDKILWSCDKN
jgi:predicted nucleic acid-binding protein